jgi:tRNA A37 threonylcarbamoyladenosine modification protein TsaB
VDHIDNVLLKLSKYNENIVFVGDGSVNYKDIIARAVKNCSFSNSNELSSYNLGLAGYNALLNNVNSDILPLYLRKSQAERMLEEKNNANI